MQYAFIFALFLADEFIPRYPSDLSVCSVNDDSGEALSPLHSWPICHF